MALATLPDFEFPSRTALVLNETATGKPAPFSRQKLIPERTTGPVRNSKARIGNCTARRPTTGPAGSVDTALGEIEKESERERERARERERKIKREKRESVCERHRARERED